MVNSVNISLGSRPRLVNCGLAEHGLRGKEEYELPTLWCLHLYFYEVQMEVRGLPFSIVPGSLTLIPPGTPIIYRYNAKRHRHFYVHFKVDHVRHSRLRLPLCQHLPYAMDELLDRLQNIQRIRTHNQFHAEISFWSLLLDVAESAALHAESTSKEDALLNRADEIIDRGFPEKINAAGLAKVLGFSMAHINRRIKARHGLTTVQLLRKRRLQRAYHLLIHSTMPIKSAAAECGMSDLQQFNKLMRREYGKSPRILRKLHTSIPAWMLNRQ